MWSKFARGTEAPTPIATDLTIGDLPAGREGEFAAAIAVAHGMPAAIVPWVSALARRPGWRAYAALDGEVLVGGAML